MQLNKKERELLIEKNSQRQTNGRKILLKTTSTLEQLKRNFKTEETTTNTHTNNNTDELKNQLSN